MYKDIDTNHIPTHIAIIMDGNGRWAKAKGQPRTAGHVQGVETVKTITEECTRLGVKFLTLYTFSTENWNRPQDEIDTLMGLVMTNLETELFVKNNVRFRVIGDRSRLPQSVQDKLRQAEQHTEQFTKMTLVVALSYSGRWELTEAVSNIVRDNPATVTEETLSAYLQTNFMPDPDLLIRTGGEQRISNFLLWQLAYSELYFCDTFWPDFGVEALHEAIASFQNRERRYGKTSEQVKNEE